MNNVSTWTEDEDLGGYDGVNDGPPPPLDPGVYDCKIVKALPGLTKESKKPKIELELRVISLHGSSEELNRKLYATLVISKETKFRLLNVAKACGIEPLTRTGNEAVQAHCAELVASGGHVIAKLKAETDQKGKPRAALDYFVSEEQLADAASGATEGVAGRRRRH